MPSSPSHPSSAYHRFATATSLVHGVSRVSGPGRKTPGSSGTGSAPIRAAILASRSRRSDSGRCFRSWSPSWRRSNKNSVAGISAESFFTRDAAGCSRSWSSSNERAPPSRINTSSPSATNVPASNPSSISATSGKNRIIGRSSRLTNDTSPSTVTRHRNPSHFGSYVQPSPTGRVVSSLASIGPLPRTVRLPIALRALPLLAHALPRVVVDLERLLRRAVLDRHVAEVDPDAGPRGAAPAHGVDHHVCRLEVRHHLPVARLPPFEAVERFLLCGSPGDLDQRGGRPPAAGRATSFARGRRRDDSVPSRPAVTAGAALRRLHARRFVVRLLVVRRPGGVAQSCPVVTLSEVQQ